MLEAISYFCKSGLQMDQLASIDTTVEHIFILAFSIPSSVYRFLSTCGEVGVSLQR